MTYVEAKLSVKTVILQCDLQGCDKTITVTTVPYGQEDLPDGWVILDDYDFAIQFCSKAHEEEWVKRHDVLADHETECIYIVEFAAYNDIDGIDGVFTSMDLAKAAVEKQVKRKLDWEDEDLIESASYWGDDLPGISHIRIACHWPDTPMHGWIARAMEQTMSREEKALNNPFSFLD